MDSILILLEPHISLPPSPTASLLNVSALFGHLISNIQWTWYVLAFLLSLNTRVIEFLIPPFVIVAPYLVVSLRPIALSKTKSRV